MTTLALNNRVLIRTPRFSINSNLAEKWEELKALIRDSSPAFFEVIKDLSHENLDHAGPKVYHTVQKYFNRACFRSTPYGAFAAVGLAECAIEQGNAVLIPAQPTLHSFPDWNAPDGPIQDVNDPGLVLFANSSYYKLQEEIRFIQQQEENYIMSAVDDDPMIQLILENCAIPVSYAKLLDKVAGTIEKDILNDYLSDLIALQLILTSQNRNIIGDDYFQRTKRENIGDSQYIIAERKILQGKLDQRLFRHLPALANLLQVLTPSHEPEVLTQFKERFAGKFEQQEVPLMLALDPEAGIGYGDMAQHEASTSLEAFLGGGAVEPILPNNSQREILYRHILENSKNKQPLTLETLLPDHTSDKPLPNSIAVGCTVADDLLFLDFMGSATANAIYGRFAHAIPEVKSLCQEIADREQAANPEVLFFDIGYTKEVKVDNINRRPAIYKLQLNILNYDTSECPLLINDIYLGLQGNEIRLRSQSLNCRLLPRMATAYNYQRSDLPLFRLLMDIQTQSLVTSLQLKLSNEIPNLSYYPRVQYKNIIVSPAAWRLPKTIIEEGKDETEKILDLRNYLQAVETVRYVKIGTADQTLLLDTDAPADAGLLVSLLEKAKDNSLIIEEAALPQCSIVKDEYDTPYLPQIILTLQHDQSIAQPLTRVQKDFPAIATKQWLPPGKDWLYFEIYTTPYRADDLLEYKIKGFIEQQRDSIIKWFFIRYNENGDHIRLRLQIKNTDNGYGIVQALSAVLSAELESGFVSDIKLCTYKKEVHRYHPLHMDAVEAHFYQDSEFVLCMIQEMFPDSAKYRLCIELFLSTANSGIIAPTALSHFLEKMTNAYNLEHNIKQLQFKEINNRYKTFYKEPPPSLGFTAATLYERLKASFIEVIAGYPELIRPKILGDLLHMHINRSFVDRQRTHEMLFYNFLSLDWKRQQYLTKKSSLTNDKEN